MILTYSHLVITIVKHIPPEIIDEVIVKPANFRDINRTFRGLDCDVLVEIGTHDQAENLIQETQQAKNSPHAQNNSLDEIKNTKILSWNIAGINSKIDLRLGRVYRCV